MAEVKFTDQALDDLHEIADYIGHDSPFYVTDTEIN